MDWLFLIVISFTVLTSHCQRHYVRQYVVRVSVVVAAQAMTAYGEVEKQLQSFLNSARDGASGQVRVLVVYSRAYILSPPPPPLFPPDILWIEDCVGFGEETKFLLLSGFEPWFLRRVNHSLVITPTELPRSIRSLYKYLGACWQIVVRSSRVLLPSVKQVWTG